MFLAYRAIRKHVKARQDAKNTEQPQENSIGQAQQNEVLPNSTRYPPNHQEQFSNISHFDDEASNPDEEITSVKPPYYEDDEVGDGTRREDHYLTGYKLILAYLSLLLALFVVAIDQTITLTILSILTEDMNSGDKITWVASAFTLGTAVTIQFWGQVGLAIGRKWVLCLAIVVFEIGSLVSALSVSMDMLIVGRVVQGLGAGGIQNTTYIIITEILPINRLTIGLIGYTIIFACGSILGPTLGGAFANITWRWCFYVNLPIGFAGIAVLIFLYNPPRPTGRILSNLKKIDVLGTLLFGGAAAMILVGITLPATNTPWSSAAVICCLAIGAGLMLVFLLWNFKLAKYPLFPWHIMRVGAIQSCFWFYFWGWGNAMLVIQFLAIYFEIMFRTSPGDTGASLLCFLLPLVLTTSISSRIIKKTGFIKPLAILGGIFMTVGGGLLTLLNETSTKSQKIGYPICIGVGAGLVVQPSLIMVQLLAPKEPGSKILSSSYITVGRNLGAAICCGVGQITYSTTLKNKLTSSGLLERYTYTELTSQYSLLTSMTTSDIALLGDAYMSGIKNCFYLSIGIGGLALFTSLFFSNKKVPKNANVAEA